MGSRSVTQKTKIDPALARQSRRAMDFAELVATLPYSPNLGVTLAGFTPQQLAAQDMANAQASAFGFAAPSQSAAQTMPATQMSPSGIAGYSIADDYMGMRDASMPTELQQFIMGLFRDPNNPNAAPANPMAIFGRRAQSQQPQLHSPLHALGMGGGERSSYDNNSVPRGTASGNGFWRDVNDARQSLGNSIRGAFSSAFGRGGSGSTNSGGSK
jgi:hypothetical protein